MTDHLERLHGLLTWAETGGYSPSDAAALRGAIAEIERLRIMLRKCDDLWKAQLRYSMPGFPLEKSIKEIRNELAALIGGEGEA